MGESQSKNERRAIRKALGPAAAKVVQTADLRAKAHGQILNRGFWGRWKWLLTGK